MGTYIIHFDDKPWEALDDEQYYHCKEIPWFSTTKTTISRLTPYTEGSAYAYGYIDGYTEAESKYREIRDELEKQAHQRGYEEAYDTAYADAEEIYESGKRAMYQKGLKDAWEAARTLWNTPNRKEIFGHTTFNTVLTTLTAQETIEKIQAYEQEKEKEIQVGDEIEAVSGKAVVVYVDDVDEHKVRYVYSNGVYAFDYIDKVTKTGRHFPEIAEVLQKMKENNDNK